MPTPPSSSTKAKHLARPASEGVLASSAGGGAGATGSSAALTADASRRVGRRRRPPLSVLMLAGAGLAVCYGHFVLGMRMGPPLVMVGLGGMTLSLCATALWRVIDPLTRNEVAAVPEVRAPHRLRELEREKQAVLKAIKEIELDYQMRKISEADYREMVERYRTRALRVMGDLAVGDDYRALIERELKDRLAARAAAAREAGGAGVGVGVGAGAVAGAEAGTVPSITPVVVQAPAVEPRAERAAVAAPVGSGPVIPSPSCATCATVNDLDARFCKKCGTNLRPSDVVR